MEEQVKTFTYVINDETIINRYGYRILNSGIQYLSYLESPTVRYMHNGEIVPIGKCLRIYAEGTKLYAEVALDRGTDFEQLIYDKVERGVINAISMGHNPLAFDETDTLPGQTRATVTKTDLLELSIVDAPGNAAAVRVLSAIPVIADVAVQEANQLNNHKNDTMNEMNGEILSLLGLAAGATDAEVVAAIEQLKAEKARVQIDAYLSAKVQAGVIEKAEVDKYRRLCAADFEGVQALLEDKAPVKKAPVVKPLESLSALIGQAKQEGAGELSFEQLSKKDPKRLLKIKQEDPVLYNQLLEASKK